MFVITLTPSKENIEKKCNVYTAKKLSDPLEMFGNHNPQQQLSPEIEELTDNAVRNILHSVILLYYYQCFSQFIYKSLYYSQCLNVSDNVVPVTNCYSLITGKQNYKV